MRLAILSLILSITAIAQEPSPLQDMVKTEQAVIERGSYVRIWKKQGGVWRVVLDITNVH